jgi:hypothetical protein
MSQTQWNEQLQYNALFNTTSNILSKAVLRSIFKI